MPDSPDPVAAALSRFAGRHLPIDERRALGGGDISRVERVTTDAGTFIVKSHPSPPPGFFQAEAAGLAALRASGTSLRIPTVIATGDEETGFLILEDLGSGRPARSFDEGFGRGLADLHRCGATQFGFERETYCGTTNQPNAWTGRWVDFFAEHRLGHQLERARRAGLLPAPDGQRIARLIARLGEFLDEPAEGPALIHGDLWSGNLHATAAGEPALIDPSAAFAHREAEFGMMTLFGGFGARVYDAYAEAFPLDRGWRDRNPIYQLYHLLNHLNLFGGAYRSQAMAVVNRFV